MVHHPVDVEDIQVFPSSVMDAAVWPEDSPPFVGDHEVVQLMDPFYLVRDVLFLDLVVQEVHPVKLY